MNLIPYLTATRKRIFDLVNGTNQIATISDINNTVDSYNKSNAATYNFSTIIVSNPVTLAASANGGACVSGGTGCWSCLNTCQYKDYVKVTSLTETAPGVFRLILDVTTPPGATPITEVSVRIPNMPTINAGVAITKVSLGVWDITTYDNTTGIVTSNLFNNTAIDVVYYYNPFVAL